MRVNRRETKMEFHLMRCHCGYMDHALGVQLWEEDEGFYEMYLAPTLCSGSFWWRVRVALRYVFGRQCGYGHWAEVLVRPSDAVRLREMLDKFLSTVDKWRDINAEW